jgi:hypothetical protein
MANFKTARTVDMKLSNVRLSYAWLFKPRENVDAKTGVKKVSYEATFLWPASIPLVGVTQAGQPVTVSDELLRIAEESWPGKAAEMLKAEVLKNPIKSGDGKDGIVKKTMEKKPGYAGMKFLQAKSNADSPPLLISNVLGADGKLVKLTDPNSLYSGCYVNAVVQAYTWQHGEGGCGISFGMSMIQFAKDGERLGGGTARPSAEQLEKDAGAFFQGAAPEKVAAVKDGEGAAGLFA